MFPAKDIMMRDVISVRPDWPVFKAIECLALNGVSGLPVVDAENRLVGIITEWDVLDLLTETVIADDETVEKYMTHQVISFEEDDSVMEISEYFQTKKARRAPIVRNGQLVGIVSRHDIIKLIISIRSKMSKLK